MSKVKAFFFDQDGVIIDTEKDGHRVAFNRTFKKHGFNFEWSVEDYHGLLQISGGKERMKHYLHSKGFGREIKPDEEDELIKKLHHDKTDEIISMLENNELPLRPGIHRFMKEICNRGLVLGVCTTSNQRAAQAVAQKMLSDIKFDFILAGDVVSRKKPDPEIYLMAKEKAGLNADECVVIEDSENGVSAAKAAGMHVVATTNFYTEREDLSQADIVVTSLGDPAGEKGELRAGGNRLDFDGVLTVDNVITYFSS
ncbi:MAG TPA: HAD-IA family hydrolase [Pelolinea sp.]|nr:HAD-IA family hydrolase [Pelolinea sp.]